MDFNKKQPAILYLDKKGFYYYEAGLAGIISLAFLDTSVKDMDVIDSTSVFNQIKSFIEQNILKPASISIVVSPNLTFEKDIVGLAQEEQEAQEKKFIDTIPFESVLARSYPIDKGVKVIGTNEELYLELKTSFEKGNFSVDSIIPYQQLGGDQSLIQNMQVENISLLLRKIDHYKQFSLLVPLKVKPPSDSTPVVTSNNTSPASSKPKSNKTRLYLMGGVFVVLIVVMIIMLMNMKP